MKRIMPSYRFGMQEDAQEFTIGFIDQLIKSSFSHPNPIQRYVIANQGCTPIFQIFGFKSRSQVLCESCGHQSNTYSEECSLSLTIPRVRGTATFQDCLDQYVFADRLSGDNKYNCDGCKRKVNALKSTCIESSPRALIVDFKRYTSGKKYNEIIQYPKSFVLKKYLSSAIDHSNL